MASPEKMLLTSKEKRIKSIRRLFGVKRCYFLFYLFICMVDKESEVC